MDWNLPDGPRGHVGETKGQRQRISQIRRAPKALFHLILVLKLKLSSYQWVSSSYTQVVATKVPIGPTYFPGYYANGS